MVLVLSFGRDSPSRVVEIRAPTTVQDQGEASSLELRRFKKTDGQACDTQGDGHGLGNPRVGIEPQSLHSLPMSPSEAL